MQAIPQDRVRKYFIRSALAWLWLAALMGVWLRWQSWGRPPLYIPARHLTHAHSHLMFLGWVFNALAGLLIPAFLSGPFRRIYLLLCAGLQIGVLGMALSFPVQGYGAVSIAFSTLHMGLAGWFAILFWRDAGRGTAAHTALHWAVAFLFVSAAGPFALGYVMANGGEGTVWYNFAVYFYLHFQYNGWMVFALLAVLLCLNPPENGRARLGVHLFGFGCVFEFALSTLWTHPPPVAYVLAACGAVLQAGGAVLLLQARWQRPWISVWHGAWAKRLAGLAFFSFALKLLFQLFAFLPGLGDLVFANRNWLIAYFHLVFIGVILLAIMALFVEKNALQAGKINSPAWWIFVLGYILTEVLLLFPQPAPIALFIAALCLFGGLSWVLATGLLRRENEKS